jgi:integrase
MASVYKKAGANGRLSPNWQAKFRGVDGEQVWLSTKLEDKRKAKAVAELWEEACRLAEAHELTQDEARKVTEKVEKITRSPRTLAATSGLVDELLKHSIDEDFKGQDFAKYCAEWLEDRKARAASASVVKYRGFVNGFIKSLAERRRSAPIASISAGEIQRFRIEETLSGKNAATVNVGIAVLRALFNSARRAGLTTTNPAEAVERLTAEGEERIPFDEGAVKLLLKEADTEWRGLILLGWQHGLRLSDATNLSWSNIDLDNQILSFRQKKTAGRARKQKTTNLALHADLVEYLGSLAVTDQTDQPLFPSFYGLRVRHEISVSNISCIWTNCIVPFSVERVGTNIYFFNLFV